MARPKHLPFLLSALAIGSPSQAQVHYHENGQPWRQQARNGPDAEVAGWFYNLGVTGLRVELVAEAKTHLLVRHVFEGSPAFGRVRAGDVVVGAGGRRFTTEHRNGYGMEVFGPDGPILEFAQALARAQTKVGKGRLEVSLVRDGQVRDVTLPVGRKYGDFDRSYPDDCDKSERILRELLAYLVDQQRDDGSFGNPIHNTFAPLALLAHPTPQHLKAVEKNVRFHARSTKAEDDGGLINWRYMAAAIVMSEFYLETKESWVLPELQEVYDFLIRSQYTDLSQVNPRVRESHPDAWPEDAMKQHGGWGHNPGFEGYGPICMLTGQGALAFALMARCGIEVDRARHDAAYAFLQRGTGHNGYLWYADDVAGHQKWADMGRTGASGIAHWMSPYKSREHREHATAHAAIIGRHPESFPDTHGSPMMGMAYAALAAWHHPASWRSLMDASRWWFTLAQCHDGTFYYQPNRDNAGYGGDSRSMPSAVVAFILSIPKANLTLTRR